ncbi:hypothetical protein EW026_g6769 [Hermanssonia centrifuga]|uniref:Dolichyl-phosphate-mannose--protein mannosyltransferase n=1 Tax=Hermanssonia centrifuga TaxID=98765 RepID=A0A4S4KEC3_9APHY|nr:hypothetical protein EW026_g6769 [Hermanssonia centrifuga]
MSASVRVRRTASPPPGIPLAAQRFPAHRHDHLDADERKAAASRGYGPSRKSRSQGGVNLTSAEWKLLVLIIVIALGVRLFRLSRPNSVVFDEVHFGKFASRYIKSQYFVDVHPPLAKLLITLAGFIFGYDGNFDFKDIAKVYDKVPYVAMRLVPAMLGVFTVPLAYLTLRALDCRATTALLASLFITFENGLITQSRHILLDSPLVFFTALTVFVWTGFCNEDKQEPFTESWDSNNEWRIVNATGQGDPYVDWDNDPITYVTSGMRVKLRHTSTDKSLHSHDFRPPVSDVDFQNEVSAYGMPGYVGDANDDWIVEIHKGDDHDREAGKRLRTLRTQFRLRHALSGCYLFSHKVKLPDWAYEQQEVTCNKNAVMVNSLWYIETSTHPNFPEDSPKVNYKRPGFLSKFLELQQVMWATNAGLTDRHTFDSRPDAWPRLRRGINFWVKDHRQIYLIGNPMVWYLSTAAIVFYIAVRGFLVLRAKRGFRDFENTKVVKYDTLCGFLFIGWSLHYLPFFLMSRQLFLHHYFPALYFAILLSCGVFDLVTSTLRPRIRLQIAAVLVVLAIWNYAYFSPLTYGNPWTKEKCKNAQWMKTWDFSCNDFLDSYSQYTVAVAPTPTKSPAVVTVGGERGGRGAVVVEDNLEKAANLPVKDSPDTTTLAFGQAEPGHDVFGGDRVEQVKSEGTPAVKPVEDDRESKEISEIQTPAPGTQEDSQEPVASETISLSASSTESASIDSQVESDKTQGPSEEGEAEAEKARNELFPDDEETR